MEAVNMRRLRTSATLASVLAILLLSCTKAQSQYYVCNQVAGDADRAVREQYQHTIDFWIKVAAAARAKGYDPRSLPQIGRQGEVFVLDVIALIETLSQRRDDAIGAIFAAYQDCQNGFQPYQNILNAGVFFITGGLSQVIPPAARHIDVSNLFSGTPFGGPNALVPQVRDQILNQLGIGGDVANFIRNPLQIGAGGPVRLSWTPALGLTGGLFPLPPLPPIAINPPALPHISPPPPIQLGTIGGHRVCFPWC
jgi:hypothetical protein